MAKTLRKPLPEDVEFMHASRDEMQSLKKSTKESRQFPLVHQGFEIKYEVYPEEDISMERHFIKECGYTQKQFDKIRDFEWFRVVINASLPGDSETLGRAHLGACCAKDAHAYVKKEDIGGYLPQMLRSRNAMAVHRGPRMADRNMGRIGG